MKKIFLVGILIFTMLVGAFAVYADSPATGGFGFTRGHGHMNGQAFDGMNSGEFNRRIDLSEEEREEWIQSRQNLFEERENLTEEERQELFEERKKERAEYREERIKAALEEGTITEEQAREWRAHFEEMDKFHEENGFLGGNNCCDGLGQGNGHRMGGRNGHSRSNGLTGGCRF